MDLLKMELYSFFLFFMKLSLFHALDREFNKWTQVDLVYLFLSFLIFFNSSTLG